MPLFQSFTFRGKLCGNVQRTGRFWREELWGNTKNRGWLLRKCAKNEAGLCGNRYAMEFVFLGKIIGIAVKKAYLCVLNR